MLISPRSALSRGGEFNGLSKEWIEAKLDEVQYVSQSKRLVEGGGSVADFGPRASSFLNPGLCIRQPIICSFVAS